MPRLADSRTIGVFPLQHEDFPNTGWDLDLRSSIYGIRVTNRKDAPGSQAMLGHWVSQRKYLGDITGGLWWERDPLGAIPAPTVAREISGWRLTPWPVIATGGWVAPLTGQTEEDGTGFVRERVLEPRLPPKLGGEPPLEGREPPVPPGCPALSSPNLLFQPIAHNPNDPRRWIDDTRFMETNLTLPRNDAGLEIVPLAPKGQFGLGIEATNEERQYNQWHRTDPRLIAVHFPGGDARMSELVADLKEDFSLAGQAAFAIDEERLARLHTFWKVVKAPFVDPNITGAPVFLPGPGIEGTNVVAWFWGSGANCPDQRPYGIVHDSWIALGSPVTGDTAEESPLGPPPPDALGLTSVHGGGPLSVGLFFDRHQYGKDADEHPINPMHLSADTLVLSSQDTTRDGPFHLDQTQDYVSNGEGVFEVVCRFDPTVDNLLPFGGLGSKGLWRWEAFLPIGEVASGECRKIIPGYDDRHRAFAYSMFDFAFGAQMFRPHPPGAGAVDLRSALRGASREQIKRYNDETPMVLRAEPFGKIYGGEDQWAKTETTGKRRWIGGTGIGGLAYMAPELDMAEYARDFAPSEITLSTAYVVAVPPIWWAAGYPNPDTGTIKTGYRWGVTSAGKLRWGRFNSSSALTETMELSEEGSLGLNTTDYGGGDGVIGLANASRVPSSNPTGGGVFYAEAGALKWRGSGGTITTIAPA